MFNLEQSIAEWRQQMLAVGIKALVLEELENHLREEVDLQTHAGFDAQFAFDAAVRQIGSAVSLRQEFSTARETVSERIKSHFLARLNVFNPQLATSMNHPPQGRDIVPAWPTYFKAAAIIIPAGLIWMVSTVFLLPKLNQACQTRGTTVTTFFKATANGRLVDVFIQPMFFAAQHIYIFGGLIICIVALLEWRFSKWPQQRGFAAGMAALVLNAMVLTWVTIMVVIALVILSTPLPLPVVQ